MRPARVRPAARKGRHMRNWKKHASGDETEQPSVLVGCLSLLLALDLSCSLLVSSLLSPSPLLPSLHCCTGESVVRTFCRHAPVRLLRLGANCNVCEVLREAWHAHPLGVVRCASFSDLAPITMSRRCPCSCSRLREAPLQLCTTAPLDIHLHTTISQPVD